MSSKQQHFNDGGFNFFLLVLKITGNNFINAILINHFVYASVVIKLINMSEMIFH